MTAGRNVSAALHAALDQLPEASPQELASRIQFAWPWLTNDEQRLLAGLVAHLTAPRRRDAPITLGASWG